MIRILFLVVSAALFLTACSAVPQRQKPAPVVNAAAPVVRKPPPSPQPGPPTVTVQEVPPAQGVEIHPYAPPAPSPGGLPAETPAGLAPPGPVANTPPPLPGAPSPPPGPGAEVQTAYARPAPSPQLARPNVSPPAEALLNEAERQAQEKKYSAAAATLERALRIEPRNAYLWNRLAHVRLDQGEHLLAGNLADKSNVLAGDATSLKQDNWNIIAAARRQSGDAAGAAEAERKARGGI